MNDLLSRAASAVARERQVSEAFIEDGQAFGAPSECFNGVHARECRAVEEALEELGFTPESYNTEIEKRIGGKFVWDNGLYAEEPCEHNSYEHC